jgi:hypothetical protein
MSTWFLARSWDKRPQSVEVEKFTEKTVTIRGRRHNQRGWECYFATEAEAWDFLEQSAADQVEKCKAQIKSYERSLIQAEKDLEKLRADRAAAC